MIQVQLLFPGCMLSAPFAYISPTPFPSAFLPLESKDAFLLVSCLGFPIPFCLFPSPGFSGSPLRRQVYTGWSFGVTTMWPVFWKGRVRWPSSQGGRLGGVMMRCGLCCISLVFGRDEAFWFQENCGSGHAMTY